MKERKRQIELRRRFVSFLFFSPAISIKACLFIASSQFSNKRSERSASAFRLMIERANYLRLSADLVALCVIGIDPSIEVMQSAIQQRHQAADRST